MHARLEAKRIASLLSLLFGFGAGWQAVELCNRRRHGANLQSSNLPGFSSDGHIGGAQFQPRSYITFWVRFYHPSFINYTVRYFAACGCLGECVVALCTSLSLLLPSPFLPVKNSVKVWKRTGPIGSREPLASDPSDLFPEASLTFTGLP